MARSKLSNWFRAFVPQAPLRNGTGNAAKRRNANALRFDRLEDRTVPTITGSFTGPLTTAVAANVNISHMTGNQHESTIAINPTNPANLFSASNLELADGNFAAYSRDGGVTWTGSVLGLGTDGLYDGGGDTQAAFDRFGNLFFTYLDSTSGNPVVIRSADGGQTFQDMATFPDGTDQPSIATGPGNTPGSQSVWVDYTTSTGGLSARGALITGLGAVGTFTAPEVVDSNGDFGGIAVGQNGQVTVVYQPLDGSPGPDPVFAATNPNGLSGAGFNAPVTVANTQVGGSRIIPAQSNNLGIDIEPAVAYDTSSGPNRGRAYCVYTDAADTTTDATKTYVKYSTDNGVTWSAAVPAFDAAANANSQFLPSVSCDPTTGNVGVAWYDCRNSPSDDHAQLFGAISTNGGVSYSQNVQISSGSSYSPGSEPAANGYRDLGYGDFNTSDFYAGSFYRVWADNSNSTGDNPDGANSTMDIYTSRVTVGGETATLAGGPAATTEYLKLDATGLYVDFWENSTPASGAPTFIASKMALTGVNFTGGAGNDTLTLDLSNGDFLAALPVNFTGGSGQNTVRVVGAGGTVTPTHNSIQIAGDTAVALSNVPNAEIDAGSAPITFAAQGWTGTSLILNGGTFASTFNLTLAPATGGIQLLGTSPANTLVIADAANGDSYSVGPGTISNGPAQVSTSSVTLQSITVNGAGTHDIFDVTPIMGVPINVNDAVADGTLLYEGTGTITHTSPTAGTIDDGVNGTITFTGMSAVGGSQLLFNAPSTGNNAIEVTAGGGTVQVFDNGALVASNPSSTTGRVVIHGGNGVQNTVQVDAAFTALNKVFSFTGGTGGQNAMSVEGTAAADTFLSAAGSVSINGTALGYTSVQKLFLDGLGGADVFQVAGLPATATALNAVSPMGVLEYSGSGTIQYTAPDSGTVTDPANRPITFTGIGGTSPTGILAYTAPTAGANTMVLSAGAGFIELTNNGVLVATQALASATQVAIVGGGGVANTLTADPTYEATPIPLSFQGGAGGANTLNIEGSAAADAFVASFGAVTLNGSATAYGGVQTLNLDGNGGGDSFDATPSATVAITVNGGSPPAALTFEGAGSINFTGPGAGNIVSTGNLPLDFTGIGSGINLTGGYDLHLTAPNPNGPNTFVMVLTPAGISVTVNGGAPLPAIAGAVHSVVIDGGSGDDTLIIDNSGGLISTSGGIIFNGNGGNNVLQVTGSPNRTVARETLTFTAFGTGTLLLDATGDAGAGGLGVPGSGSERVSFNGDQSVATTTPAAQFDDFGLGGSAFTLVDGGTAGTAQTLAIQEAGGSGIQTASVANAATVTVNGMGGAVSFLLDNHTAAAGLTDLQIYGNELTGGTLHPADAAAESFTVNGTAGFTTTVTAQGGSSAFAIAGDGLAGQNTFLGAAGTNAFSIDAGTGITASSVHISGGGASSLAVGGPTGGGSLSFAMAGGSFGEKVTGLGTGLGGSPALAFDSVQNVSFVGSATGNTDLAVVDDTNTAYAGVGAKALNLLDGIIYRPTGAQSGDLRTNLNFDGTPLTPSVTPAVRFSNIGGTFSISGNGTGSGTRDTLTVLGVSAAGSASPIFAETTAADPADQVTISDTLVTIANASLGQLRAVAFDPKTIANLVYRAGNKSGTQGDAITATASRRTNLLVDAMSAHGADKVTVKTAGAPSYSRTGDPSRGGPQVIVSGSDGAFVGILDGAAVASAHFVTVGQDTGGYQIQVYDAANLSAPKFTLEPYFSTFRGGIRVAVGDVNGDGIPDIVTVNGPGADSNVEAFDGVDGHLLTSFIAYKNYAGGATVAVGDVNGDGYGDIITGSDAGVAPHVEVFSGKDGALLDSFYAFSTGFLGGISVAAGDVEGSGKADIIVGAASGSSPHVIVFRQDLSVAASYFAFAQGFLGGVTVAVLDADGSGKMDIVVGAASGTDPHLEVFAGVSQKLLASFDVPNTGTTKDTSGTLDLSTLNSGSGAPGQILYGRSNGSVVRRFQIVPTVNELTPFTSFDPTFGFGVYVGAN